MDRDGCEFPGFNGRAPFFSEQNWLTNTFSLVVTDPVPGGPWTEVSRNTHVIAVDNARVGRA